MLPAMAISDIPAMVHQPQIASVVVQAVAIDMVTLLFSSISMERLRLHRPGLPPGRRGIHLPGTPQVDVARLAAFAPGGHPVGVDPGAPDLLRMPDMQVL
jgi:hypothetical protein